MNKGRAVRANQCERLNNALEPPHTCVDRGGDVVNKGRAVRARQCERLNNALEPVVLERVVLSRASSPRIPRRALLARALLALTRRNFLNLLLGTVPLFSINTMKLSSRATAASEDK